MTVLGIGNEHMGDDGIGPVVARALMREDFGADVEVVVGALAGMGLIRHFRRSRSVIVIDAIDAGAEPGSVFRFDPDEAGVTRLRSNNIHGMGVGYLVTNARLVGADPEVVVYAVQVGDVMPSDELSPAVGEAVEAVREMVIGEIARLS